MFSPGDVQLTQGKTVVHRTYAEPEQAALVAVLANLEIRSQVEVPADEPACAEWRQAIFSRLADRERHHAQGWTQTPCQLVCSRTPRAALIRRARGYNFTSGIVLQRNAEAHRMMSQFCGAVAALALQRRLTFRRQRSIITGHAVGRRRLGIPSLRWAAEAAGSQP